MLRVVLLNFFLDKELAEVIKPAFSWWDKILCNWNITSNLQTTEEIRGVEKEKSSKLNINWSEI